MSQNFDVQWCRRQFPAFATEVAGQPAVFFDGPAGSQVPRRVIDAVAEYFTRCNANHGGLFQTSRQSDAILAAARQALADFLDTADPNTITFGPNMTSLTFALSRALAKTWRPGDEVLVTSLEHDANYTPWTLAARDAGATVRCVDIRAEDCTLDMGDFARKLSGRTKLVAIAAVSNAVGTVNPIDEIIEAAHAHGALVFVDAVHHAPHARIYVDRWGCDFLACSAYKFFGPHVGVLWGRRELLESLTPYKVRPAPDTIPDRWMTGTQNHEGIAGTLAAIEYLADLGRMVGWLLEVRQPSQRVMTTIIGRNGGLSDPNTWEKWYRRGCDFFGYAWATPPGFEPTADYTEHLEITRRAFAAMSSRRP